VAAAVMLFTPELFRLFIDSAYHAAIPIVFCGVISNFLNGIFNIINLSFYITKRAGNIAGAVILGAVANIVLNLVLIPRWGIMGASVASVVAYLGIVVLNFNIAEKQLPVGYSPLYIAASLVLVCGVAVVNIFVPHTLLYTALKLALVIIPTILLLWRYRSFKQIITHIQENIHGSDLSTE
jgi:O-antigen/teichoic acid export membrane protein